MKLMLNVRPEDYDEWVAATNMFPVDLLIDRLHNPLASPARVALDPQGEPLCIWGVDADASEGEGVGMVWLVAATTAAPHFVNLHRHLKPELEAIHKAFPTVYGVADERNKLHHKWLQWLGFKDFGVLPYGPWNMPFRWYERTQH